MEIHKNNSFPMSWLKNTTNIEIVIIAHTQPMIKNISVEQVHLNASS